MDGLNGKIQQRAYGIYRERGNKPGNALQDWLKAEKEVLSNTRQDTQGKNGLKKA